MLDAYFDARSGMNLCVAGYLSATTNSKKAPRDWKRLCAPQQFNDRSLCKSPPWDLKVGRRTTMATLKLR